jgi:hypothetical protein
LTSRIAGQSAAALGGESDPYGGIGRNGAVQTPAPQMHAGAGWHGLQVCRRQDLQPEARAIIQYHGSTAKPSSSSVERHGQRGVRVDDPAGTRSSKPEGETLGAPIAVMVEP